MVEILVDVERRKYPHSGVGFFCKCLELGMRSVFQELGGEHSLSFYGVPTFGQSDYYPHRFWHQIYNPATLGKDVVYITHQLQTYFSCVSDAPKYIVTLHDLNFLHERLKSSQVKRRLAIVRKNLNRADVIVCISDYVRSELLQNLHLFDLKSHVKIEVIYNGLIFSEYGYNKTVDFEKLEGVRYLLSIGVLHEKKQQHLLIEMLSFLPNDFHLVLLFSSEQKNYRQELNRLIALFKLESRVHFYQNLPNEDKLFLLNGCTAYLHPSIAEGFGIPPIEAMHCSKPVFLSKATSLPEIGGHEAYYFSTHTPQDMSLDLLKGLREYSLDIDKPQRLRDWSKRYDYRRMAREYLSLI